MRDRSNPLYSLADLFGSALRTPARGAPRIRRRHGTEVLSSVQILTGPVYADNTLTRGLRV